MARETRRSLSRSEKSGRRNRKRGAGDGILELHNPHSVLAVIHTRPESVLSVEVSRHPTDAWRQVAAAAGRARIAVHTGSASRSSERASRDTERQASSRAMVRQPIPVSLDELLGTVEADCSGVWLALDQIQDPQNLGTIFRSAAFFGVRGIVVSRNRSAPVNATVCDVAAGGVEHVPFCVVTNLARSLDDVRNAGLWTLGSSEHSQTDILAIDRDRPWILVLGNEQTGLRRLTLEKCDEVCRLSPRGSLTSLNVAVAAGSLLTVLTAPAS